MNAALTIYSQDPQVLLAASGSYAMPSRGNDKPRVQLTRFPQLWGWATWRDAWNEIRRTSQDEPALTRSTTWQGLSFLEKRDWSRMFRMSQGPTATTWDYRVVGAIWAMNKFAVTPSLPLTRNIGFGENATHAEAPPRWYYEPEPSQLAQLMNGLDDGSCWPTTYHSADDHTVRTQIYSPPATSRVLHRLRLRSL